MLSFRLTAADLSWQAPGEILCLGAAATNTNSSAHRIIKPLRLEKTSKIISTNSRTLKVGDL